MTDYAFIPGITPWELRYRTAMSTRGTVVYPPPVSRDGSMNKLSQFLTELQNVAPSYSVNSLILCAHGNVDHFTMLLSDFHADKIEKEKRAKVALFEDLQDADANGDIKIPDDLVPAGSFVHVKGCSVGRFQPLLTEFKKALGGNVYVTAPKFLDAVIQPKGNVVEYLQRDDCSLLRKTLGKDGNEPISATNPKIDQAGLIQAFQDKKFTMTDGTDVPAFLWKKAIPRNIEETTTTPGMWLDFAPGLSFGFYDVKVPFTCRKHTDYFADVPNSSSIDTMSQGEIEQLLIEQLKKDPLFSSDPNQNPWPMWERYGQTGLNEFVTSRNWEKNESDLDSNLIEFAGWRYRFQVLFPEGSIGTMTLSDDLKCVVKKFNFFPASGPLDSSRMLLSETDAALFTAV